MANPNAMGSPTVASPSRPGGRHQIKRSLTEFTSPSKSKGHQSRHSVHRQDLDQDQEQHRHSLSHSHHHHHHQRLHRKNRHRDEKEPHTAHPSVNRHSMDMPRPDILSHSRNTSAWAQQRFEPINKNSSAPGLNKNSEEEKEIQKEVDKAEDRVEGLKSSLAELHAFSSTTTRRLDESYFAVLEKTSALQNTVAALKDLAEASQEIYTEFEKDSAGLEEEISRQITSLGRFESQETRIEELQSRIRSGRSKIQSLSGRVDAVRDRVESWERAAQDWQDRTRRRLTVIWSVIFFVALLIASLTLTFRNTVPEVAIPPLDVIGEALPEKIREGAHNVTKHIPPLLRGGGGARELEEPLILTRAARGEDDRLRGFDEL